jgi:UDP-N-acetylmuramoylalanine-D-glutamate ligase
MSRRFQLRMLTKDADFALLDVRRTLRYLSEVIGVNVSLYEYQIRDQRLRAVCEIDQARVSDDTKADIHDVVQQMLSAHGPIDVIF